MLSAIARYGEDSWSAITRIVKNGIGLNSISNADCVGQYHTLLEEYKHIITREEPAPIALCRRLTYRLLGELRVALVRDRKRLMQMDEQLRRFETLTDQELDEIASQLDNDSLPLSTSSSEVGSDSLQDVTDCLEHIADTAAANWIHIASLEERTYSSDSSTSEDGEGEVPIASMLPNVYGMLETITSEIDLQNSRSEEKLSGKDLSPLTLTQPQIPATNLSANSTKGSADEGKMADYKPSVDNTGTFENSKVSRNGLRRSQRLMKADMDVKLPNSTQTSCCVKVGKTDTSNVDSLFVEPADALACESLPSDVKSVKQRLSIEFGMTLRSGRDVKSTQVQQFSQCSKRVDQSIHNDPEYQPCESVQDSNDRTSKRVQSVVSTGQKGACPMQAVRTQVPYNLRSSGSKIPRPKNVMDIASSTDSCSKSSGITTRSTRSVSLGNSTLECCKPSESTSAEVIEQSNGIPLRRSSRQKALSLPYHCSSSASRTESLDHPSSVNARLNKRPGYSADAQFGQNEAVEYPMPDEQPCKSRKRARERIIVPSKRPRKR